MPQTVVLPESPSPQAERSPQAPQTWVLLGPLARESATWGDAPARVLARIRSVQPRASLHQLDLPGTGRLCRQASPSDVEGLLAQLRARVRAAGLQGPFGVIASSWACCVATEWARAHGEELGAVVLISPRMRPFTTVLRSVRPGLWSAALAQVLARRFPLERDHRLWNSHTQLSDVPDEVVQHWQALRRQHPVRARNGWRHMMAVWRYETSKRRPHTQVLLLAGKGDAWLDWRVSAAISRAWGAALRVHPEAGHDLLLDDPDWVARSLAEWLLPVGSGGLISNF